MADLNRAIQCDERFANAYASRARLYELKSNEDASRALEHLRKAEQDLLKALSVAEKDWAARDLTDAWLKRVQAKINDLKGSY